MTPTSTKEVIGILEELRGTLFSAGASYEQMIKAAAAVSYLAANPDSECIRLALEEIKTANPDAELMQIMAEAVSAADQ